MGQAALLQVLLMVVFGHPEGGGGYDLGRDRPRELALPAFFRRARQPFLLGVMEENGGAVLRADIWALAIERGGIVIRPEDIEQLVVGDARRVEIHLDSFGMPGLAGADILIGRRRFGA